MCNQSDEMCNACNNNIERVTVSIQASNLGKLRGMETR